MWQRATIVLAVCLTGCASQPPPPLPVADVPESTWQPATAPPPPPVSRADVPPIQPRVQKAALPPMPAVERARPAPPPQVRRSPTLIDAAIVSAIISRSRASYPGNCGCPDDRDRAGRRCGGRSAYSRAGGYSVVCYPRDVTPQMVASFKETGQ